MEKYKITKHTLPTFTARVILQSQGCGDGFHGQQQQLQSDRGELCFLQRNHWEKQSHGVDRNWRRKADSTHRTGNLLCLRGHPCQTTKTPETKNLMRQNCPLVPSPSSGQIQRKMHQYTVQPPGGHQHWQIQPRIGQELQTQNSLKIADPVYRKQFKILEVHHKFIEQALEEWLKLGALQFTYFLRSEKARTRTQKCAGLPEAEPELPYWQVFHERNYWVHPGHWQSQFKDFLHIGSNFRILANEVGGAITAAHSFYHTRKRAVPLDHVIDGATGLPSLFPMPDGRGAKEHSECDHVHWWLAGALWHSRETLRHTGASPYQTRAELPQDQLGQMHFWKQGGLLPGAHPDPRRYQTWKEQT